MSRKVFVKTPAGVLDYGFDWSTWLDGDTLQSSTLIADAGITIGASNNNDTIASVWLQGGVIDSLYRVTNRITTVGGRTDERTMFIQIVEDRTE